MRESYQNEPKSLNPGSNPNATFSSTTAKPVVQKPAASERTSLLSNNKPATTNAADIDNRPWYRKLF